MTAGPRSLGPEHEWVRYAWVTAQRPLQPVAGYAGGRQDDSGEGLPRSSSEDVAVRDDASGGTGVAGSTGRHSSAGRSPGGSIAR